jgi:hypothetical protein
MEIALANLLESANMVKSIYLASDSGSVLICGGIDFENPLLRIIYQAARNGIACNGMIIVAPWLQLSEIQSLLVQVGLKRIITNDFDLKIKSGDGE